MQFLDGLKVMSMAWIILGHGFLLLVDVPLSNYSDILEVLRADHNSYKQSNSYTFLES